MCIFSGRGDQHVDGGDAPAGDPAAVVPGRRGPVRAPCLLRAGHPRPQGHRRAHMELPGRASFTLTVLYRIKLGSVQTYGGGGYRVESISQFELSLSYSLITNSITNKRISSFSWRICSFLGRISSFSWRICSFLLRGCFWPINYEFICCWITFGL